MPAKIQGLFNVVDLRHGLRDCGLDVAPDSLQMFYDNAGYPMAVVCAVHTDVPSMRGVRARDFAFGVKRFNRVVVAIQVNFDEANRLACFWSLEGVPVGLTKIENRDLFVTSEYRHNPTAVAIMGICACAEWGKQTAHKHFDRDPW